MAEVTLQECETLENALRRFKRKVMTEDIIREVKRHAFDLKPGQKRRVESAWPVNAIERRLGGRQSRNVRGLAAAAASRWPRTPPRRGFRLLYDGFEGLRLASMRMCAYLESSGP